MEFFQFYGIDWLATVLGLSGVYLLGNKNKIGFIIFMGASVSWVTFGAMTGSFPVIIGSSIFFIMHLRGFLSWSKEAKALEEKAIG